ncbi:sirohydrochlorin cobaltochelatase [Clostridium sp. YIM B02506]|uniref:sirohydrochlorin cobaltochelatase n=1 Tax=Clostridium sp. YIM B02506 TaxID=2910680 RepID=UPI001EED91C2|nr:sirohydrochlorin cobaltochelatase [Clostridium sp. YIM B02506]
MKAILVVTHGTANLEGVNSSLKPLIKEIKKEFSGDEVRLAFTSKFIINKLFKQSGIKVNNLEEELEALIELGCTEVFILPLHLIPGKEYLDLLDVVESYRNRITAVVATPLLSEDEDYMNLINSLDPSKELNYVYMAHGTNHEGNSSYLKLQQEFINKGYGKVLIGTLEGTTTLEDIIYMLKSRNINKIVLQPLLLMRGKHGTKDLDSWEELLINNGFEVEKIDKSLGEIEEVRKLYINKLNSLYN